MSGIGTPAIPSTGGGGGGGSVTQGTSPWVDNITQIGGAAFSLGQQASSASLPVVLTAAQLITLTPLSSVAATQSGTWNVGLSAGSNVIGHVIVDSGAITATLAAETTKVIGTVNQGTSPWVVSGAITFSSPQHIIVDSGVVTSVTAITNALPAGSNVIGHVIVDTASTTAVTQATGSNLHMVVDSGTITTVTSITNQVDVNVKQFGGSNVINGGTAGVQSVGGSVATNVAITANPLNLGAQAVSSENSAVTTARQVQLVADLVGKLIVLPYANPENFVSFAMTAAMTGTTSTITLAAPAAGLRNYITQITVSNSHATVGTDILIQDGNGGTTIYVIPSAPGFGGATLTFPTPLRQPTTGTAIYVANVTTGSNTKVSLSGYKGA